MIAWHRSHKENLAVLVLLVDAVVRAHMSQGEPPAPAEALARPAPGARRAALCDGELPGDRAGLRRTVGFLPEAHADGDLASRELVDDLAGAGLEEDVVAVVGPDAEVPSLLRVRVERALHLVLGHLLSVDDDASVVARLQLRADLGLAQHAVARSRGLAHDCRVRGRAVDPGDRSAGGEHEERDGGAEGEHDDRPAGKRRPFAAGRLGLFGRVDRRCRGVRIVDGCHVPAIVPGGLTGCAHRSFATPAIGAGLPRSTRGERYLCAVAQSRMSTEIGRVLGQRYRIVAPIGMGASAQVFLADDARLRRRVAVKMLHEALADDADFLRRFRAEARAAAALSHPNVVAVFDWGDDEVAFIVTEFLAGGSLRALLDEGGLLSPGQALLVGLEAARALDYAHRRGFVHRDIKPANLLFGEEGRLRVADFGLARALAEAAWTEPQGAVLGTARYASPELATGDQLTGKADVYSLALVLIEAVTGQVPFTADTTLGTLMARVDRPLEVPEELGPLRRVLERAGAADPAERIDARTMAGGLLAAARGLGRPEPLPLAGALPRDGETVVDDDPTLHAPVGDVGDAGGPGLVDLRDDDLDLEPPDWVSSAEPALAFRPEVGADRVAPIAPDEDGAGEQPAVDLREAAPVAVPETEAELATIAAGPASATEPVFDREAEPVLEPAVGDDGGGGTTPGSDRRRRRRWPFAVAAAVLLIGAGVAAAFLLVDNTPTYPVPDFSRGTVAAARQAATPFRWKVETISGRRDGSTPGQILRSEPPAGDRLKRGGTLKLVISAGNSLATIPTNMTGKPVAAVQTRLKKLGLVPKALRRFDEKVAKGAVIGVAPRTPRRLPKGSTVALVVSNGPKPRTVPNDLTGISLSAAKARLTALQLKAKAKSEPSETVPKDQVISAKPAPGASVPRDSTVTLAVSTGPAPRIVPDGLTGASESSVTAKLTGMQLKVTSTSRFDDTVPVGSVISVAPGSGAKLERGRDRRPRRLEGVRPGDGAEPQRCLLAQRRHLPAASQRLGRGQRQRRGGRTSRVDQPGGRPAGPARQRSRHPPRLSSTERISVVSPDTLGSVARS